MEAELSLALLENLPNPALVKDSDLNYIWMNEAFEEMFGVVRQHVIGRTDAEVFVDRQASQCNGGDLRVLETGEIDHAEETIVGADGDDRDIITRKSRLTLSDGSHVLVGVLHDVTTVSQLNRELQESRSRLTTLAHDMRRLSMLDPLTSVWNRRGFAETIEGSFATGGSIAVLDLDHFKKINDKWGHEVGDEALIHVTTVISEVLANRGELARLGGEEFAIYLASSDHRSNLVVVESIRSQIEASPLVTANQSIRLTASLGLAHISAGEKLSDLLRRADEAVYRAKAAGRNCVMNAGVDAALVS